MINVKILTNDELNCLLVRLENELASRQSKVFLNTSLLFEGFNIEMPSEKNRLLPATAL